MDPKAKDQQNPMQDQVVSQPASPVSSGHPEVGPIQEVERPVSDYSSYPAPPSNMPPVMQPTPTVKISDDIASTPSIKVANGLSLEDAMKAKDGSIDQSVTWEANEVIKEDKKVKKAA